MKFRIPGEDKGCRRVADDRLLIPCEEPTRPVFLFFQHRRMEPIKSTRKQEAPARFDWMMMKPRDPRNSSSADQLDRSPVAHRYSVGTIPKAGEVVNRQPAATKINGV